MFAAWVLKFVTGSFGATAAKAVGAVFGFIDRHFMTLCLIALIGVAYHAGKVKQEGEDHVLFAQQAEAFRKSETARADAIIDRVKAAEKDSRDRAAKAVKDKEAAEDAASKTMAEYTALKAKHDARVIELQKAKNELKKAGVKPTDPRMVALDGELTGLKLSYGLSPLSVATINKLVDDYSGGNK